MRLHPVCPLSVVSIVLIRRCGLAGIPTTAVAPLSRRIFYLLRRLSPSLRKSGPCLTLLHRRYPEHNRPGCCTQLCRPVPPARSADNLTLLPGSLGVPHKAPWTQKASAKSTVSSFIFIDCFPLISYCRYCLSVPDCRSIHARLCFRPRKSQTQPSQSKTGTPTAAATRPESKKASATYMRNSSPSHISGENQRKASAPVESSVVISFVVLYFV